MNDTREALLGALTGLSALYPTMRFGQTVEMVASMAGAETIDEMERVSEDRLLHEAVEHFADRTKQLGLERVDMRVVSSERTQLIDGLKISLPRHETLIHALARIASDAKTTLYDIEDNVVLDRLKLQSAMA